MYNDTEEIELPDDMLLLEIEEPESFKQVVKESDWKKAMQAEMDTIERNKTWVLTDLLLGRKAISQA